MDVFDPETGELLQISPALPEGWTGPGMGAAVRIHPDGRFLYASLRGPHCMDPASSMRHTCSSAPVAGSIRWTQMELSSCPPASSQRPSGVRQKSLGVLPPLG